MNVYIITIKVSFYVVVVVDKTLPISILKYLFDLLLLLLVLDHLIPLLCHKLKLHFFLLDLPLLIHLVHISCHEVESHAVV
jgi:hypothetical protein